MVALRSNQLYEIATNPWVLNTGPSIDSEKSIMLRQHIPNTWKNEKIRKWEQNGTKERKTNQWVNGRARSTNIHPESQSKIIKESSSRRAKLDRQASPVISTVMIISWWAHHLNVYHCNIIISFIIHSCGLQSWKVWPIDQVRSLVMVNTSSRQSHVSNLPKFLFTFAPKAHALWLRDLLVSAPSIHEKGKEVLDGGGRSTGICCTNTWSRTLGKIKSWWWLRCFP